MDADSVQNHIDALSSTDRKARSDAARALARSRADAAVAPMLEILASSTDNNLRELLINALGRIGDSRAIVPLAKLIDDSKCGVAAVSALYRLGVFRHVGRGRMFKLALTVATRHKGSELKDLVLEDRVTRETMHDLLPPMM